MTEYNPDASPSAALCPNVGVLAGPVRNRPRSASAEGESLQREGQGPKSPDADIHAARS